MVDVQLKAMLIDRERLLKELAGVLHRAGPNEQQRAAMNKVLAKKRKGLRAAVRFNSEQIAAYCMLHFHLQQENSGVEDHEDH